LIKLILLFKLSKVRAEESYSYLEKKVCLTDGKFGKETSLMIGFWPQ